MTPRTRPACRIERALLLAAATLATASLSGCGMLFGGDDSVDPMRLDSELPALRVVLTGTETIHDELGRAIVRELSASGRYSTFALERDDQASLLTDPFVEGLETRVVVVHTGPVETARASATRIPYLWGKVASVARVPAEVSVVDRDAGTLLGGSRVVGEGKGPWSHRIPATGSPSPPDAAERERMEEAAAMDLARRIRKEIDRLETFSAEGDAS